MATQDQDELQALKTWWKENWLLIVGGLAISFAIVFGYRSWQGMQRDAAEAASDVFAKASTAATLGELDGLKAAVDTLKQEYSRTPYAAQAALLLAAAAVEAADFAAAESELRWVMENTSDEELALLARLRLARAMLANDKAAEVPALLASVEAGGFASLYAETRGDALLLQGDREGARAAYQEALDLLEEGVGNREVVEMKLQNVRMPLDALATGEAVDAGEATEVEAPANDPVEDVAGVEPETEAGNE